MKATSKFLSLVLRHKPEAIGIDLDAKGWVEIGDLLEKLAASGKAVSLSELLHIVESSEKKRFTLSEDGLRIRAAQEHSVDVDLGLPPLDPPPRLFHGTASRFLDSILKEGLKPQSRQQVNLSSDMQTAVSVGGRHGKPLVLRLEARQMHEAGHMFYRAENGVWLTDYVPVSYLVPMS